jgi:hypothetical protein
LRGQRHRSQPGDCDEDTPPADLSAEKCPQWGSRHTGNGAAANDDRQCHRKVSCGDQPEREGRREDTLKNKRARTVPLVSVVVPIVDRWSAGKSPGEWLLRCAGGRSAAGNELAAVGQLA